MQKILQPVLQPLIFAALNYNLQDILLTFYEQDNYIYDYIYMPNHYANINVRYLKFRPAVQILNILRTVKPQ